MKKIAVLFILLLELAYANIDYEQLKTDRDYCYKLETSQCVLELLDKYSKATPSWQNVLYYDYGCMLLHEKNYTKAQENFKLVLSREKNNQKLISSAKSRLNEINELYSKIKTANNLDAGNYFNKEKEKIVWKKPYSIKVYIASNTGKESILKQAFAIWDDKLYKSINFTYVQNEKDADIVIKYVDKLNGNTAGITKYPKVVLIGGKKYLYKVNIEVSMTNSSGGKYTDTNLLSIALHEIGHGLGLNYHSNNLNDIMYYSSESYKNNNISKRDVNTIQQLYR